MYITPRKISYSHIDRDLCTASTLIGQHKFVAQVPVEAKYTIYACYWFICVYLHCLILSLSHALPYSPSFVLSFLLCLRVCFLLSTHDLNNRCNLLCLLWMTEVTMIVFFFLFFFFHCRQTEYTTKWFHVSFCYVWLAK